MTASADAQPNPAPAPRKLPRSRSFVASTVLHGVLVGGAIAAAAGVHAVRPAPPRIAILASEAAPDLPTPERPVETVVVEQPPADEADPSLVEPEPARWQNESKVSDQRESDAPCTDRFTTTAWSARVRPLPKEEQATAAAPPPARPPAAQPPASKPKPAIEAVPGKSPPPPYPMQARRRGWEGIVTVAITIDDTGRVTNCDVAESSSYRVLDRAALRAVREWRFRNGPGSTEIEIEFRLSAP